MISPLERRYGSSEMRNIWDETYKRKVWRSLWVELARYQLPTGLVTEEQVRDLESHTNEIDLEASYVMEQETHHELVAEMRVFASQAKLGGKILHLGATSTDILDNTDVLLMRDSLLVLKNKVQQLIQTLSVIAYSLRDIPTDGFTHLQVAQPTTVGYRLAFTIQDLQDDKKELENVLSNLRMKGFRGAVGTRATFRTLNLPNASMQLPTFIIVSQVYPRKQDWRVLNVLAGLAATLSKFALDIRLLQSPLAGEIQEEFQENQVGSSAMPYKQNPILSEKICGLARYVVSLPRNAWDNAANSALERTLDDSSNRRMLLPEAFLLTDEILETAQRVVRGLHIDLVSIKENLACGNHGAESKILDLVSVGFSREEAYEQAKDQLINSFSTGDASQRVEELLKSENVESSS